MNYVAAIIAIISVGLMAYGGVVADTTLDEEL